MLRGHCGSVSSVKIITQPDIIFSTSEDATLRAWKTSDFSCAAVYKYVSSLRIISITRKCLKFEYFHPRGHNSPVWGLDVSALNLYVATASQDRTARLWTVDKTFPLRVYIGHYGSVTVRIHLFNEISSLQISNISFFPSALNFTQTASTWVLARQIKQYDCSRSSTAKLLEYLPVILAQYIVFLLAPMANI